MSNPERHPSIKRHPFAGSCHCGAIKYIVHLTLPLTSSTSTSDLTYDDIHTQTKHRIYRCNCNLCHKLGQFHIRLPYAPDDFLITKPRTHQGALDDFVGTYIPAYGENQRWMFCKKCGAGMWGITGEFAVTQVQLPWYLIDHDGYNGRSYEDSEEAKEEKRKLKEEEEAAAATATTAKEKEDSREEKSEETTGEGEAEKQGTTKVDSAETGEKKDKPTAPVEDLIQQVTRKREAEDFELITIDALHPAGANGAKWKEPPNYFSLNAVTLDLCQDGLDLRKWHENGWISYVDGLEWTGGTKTDRPHVGGMY